MEVAVWVVGCCKLSQVFAGRHNALWRYVVSVKVMIERRV